MHGAGKRGMGLDKGAWCSAMLKLAFLFLLYKRVMLCLIRYDIIIIY